MGARKAEDQDLTVPLTLQIEILRTEKDSKAGEKETQSSWPHQESVLPQGSSDVPEACS